MLTPSWETSPGALVALLNSISAEELVMADLYTITLPGGLVLRYTGGDMPVTLGSTAATVIETTGDRPDIRRGRWRQTAVSSAAAVSVAAATRPDIRRGRWRQATAGGSSSTITTWSVGPIIQRGRIKVAVGIAVDSLQLRISAGPDVLVNGIPLIKFLTRGGFRGARVKLERLFCSGDGTPVGTVVRFTGRWGEVSGGRHEKQVSIDSDTALLNTMIPREVYQAGCKNDLYDGRCGLSKAAYTVAITCTATDGSRTRVSCTRSLPVDHHARGVLTCTGGENVGISRTVRSNSLHELVTTAPFPFDIAVGDTFTVPLGCDKTVRTCIDRFDNLLRFRGEPFIPVPSTVT